MSNKSKTIDIKTTPKAKQDLQQMERELEQTEQELEQLGLELQQAERELEQTERNLEQMEQDLQQAKNSFKNAENTPKESKTGLSLQQMEQELERTEQELEQLGLELQQAEQELEQTERNLEQMEQDLQQAKRTHKNSAKMQKNSFKNAENTPKESKTGLSLQQMEQDLEQAEQELEQTERNLEQMEQDLKQAKRMKKNSAKMQKNSFKNAQSTTQMEKIAPQMEKNTTNTPNVTQVEKGANVGGRLKKTLRVLGKRYFITSFSGMAIGLFCTLIAGTILQTLSDVFVGWANPVASFLFTLGFFAKILMGAGIGAGIAFDLKANKLTLATAAAAGFVGAFASSFYALGQNITAPQIVFGAAGLPGNPINSFLCAVAAVELGKFLSGKTKVDILVVPICSLLAAGLVAFALGKPVDLLIEKISGGIKSAMDAQPLAMSIIISVSMGILLTMPTSSAAIGFAAGLSGFAAGAAVAGCCAHMIGFAAMSFRENKWGGVVSQGLGTSMLQIPNIAKNPLILIPPIVASALTGPLAVLVFKLRCDAAGSGMGTAGLVGVIQTIKISIDAKTPLALLICGVALCLFVLPAAICLALSEFMRARGWIKLGDMKIN